MKLFHFLFGIALSVFLFSCSTQKPLANYLQSYNDTTGKGKVTVPELVIQKDDQLSIQVYSASTKPDVSDAIYNLPAIPGASASSTTAPSGGFLVDANGNIEYPRIGLLHAEGLTKLQLAEVIKRKINEKDSVLTNPSVVIRFMNMKITVLGEVNSQGVLNFPGEKITVLQAIGLAGGINDFGLKESVKVLRETNGVREVGVIDLSSEKLFESPFYLLRQNDVVMVDPSKRKNKLDNETANIRRASFALSFITAAAVLYNIFK